MMRITPVWLSAAYGVLSLAVAATAAAQDGFHYPAPPASSYTVSRDVRYAAGDTGALRMDVYRPAAGSAVSPVLVFYTAGSARGWASYVGWARVAASKGLVAVVADLRNPAAADDFRTLLSHLIERGAEYGIDTAAVAVFGASSNAFNSFPLVEDARETRIKAAVMYYSGAPVTQFRRDLPVLYLRTGLDRPMVNLGIDTVVARALAQNAPITVINHAGGHHGFETTDNDVITHDIVDQTIDFVKRVTRPAYRAALAAGVGSATAAAHVLSGNFALAATTYADLVARKPDDAALRLSYGEALLGDRQFAAACTELAKLKGKGLGPRDLGLPAARACLQSGDADAAVAWLASIPKHFLPPRVKDEPVFAPLANRADFKALFE